MLEIGCADAFGTRIVQQEVGIVTAVDFDPVFVARRQPADGPPLAFGVPRPRHAGGPRPRLFEGIYSLDVLEHIQPADEGRFLANIVSSLAEHGTVILGIPSLQSQAYASPPSKAGHVNCQDRAQFKATLRGYFHNVFVFSMNDEVVHTGYYPMAHYLLALCCGKR